MMHTFTMALKMHFLLKRDMDDPTMKGQRARETKLPVSVLNISEYPSVKLECMLFWRTY